MKCQFVVQFLALVATGVCAVSASDSSSSPSARSKAVKERSHSTSRAYLSFDDTRKYFEAGRVAGAMAEAGASRIAADAIKALDDGTYVSCLPVYGGAQVSDCEAVIDQISATDKNFTIAAGMCMNWESGTCMARVCAQAQAKSAFVAEASWIAQKLSADAMNECVPRGESAVVADCQEFVDPCGHYRLWLVDESAPE